MNARTQLRILAGIFATWSPKTKIITERDYEINGCLAHSFTIEYQTDKPSFRRMDCLLTKPDLNVIGYMSPNDVALEENTCKSLFNSISIKAKWVL